MRVRVDLRPVPAIRLRLGRAILHIRVLRDRPAIHVKTTRYLRARHSLPVESPDILHNGHRYRHVPFLPERRPAATGRIKTDWQLGNIQAAAPMPLTSPGNDDDTGENHQPTLRKNTAEPVEQTLKQNSDLAHAEPLAVPQLVDPDAFLCRQVGIGFHIECNAFSSVVDLNTSNHRQALHFYLEPGDVEKLVEYAVHQALCGCLFILVENILPGKRSSLTPSTTQRRNPTHENSNSAIIYVFQPNLSPVLTFYNQNKVHWATFSNFGV